MNEKILNEMQDTLNQLKNILKEQKRDINKLLQEEKIKEQHKRDYKINIQKYIKYNQLKTINDLEKQKIKENDKYIKEEIHHSKKMINEYYNKKYNNNMIENLEDFVLF